MPTRALRDPEGRVADEVRHGAKRPSPPLMPLLALAQQAGNRAFAGLVGARTVQRHDGPTTEADAEARLAAAPDVAAAANSFAPEGGTGTGTTSPPAPLTGAARTKAIEDTLNASDSGKWALGIVKKWSITVDYEYAGTGSFQSAGKIYVNKNKGIGAAAITMMHECQHADTYKSGKQADATKLTKAEYVRQSIADECEAVVRQVEGFEATKASGAALTNASMNQGLKDRYQKVFDKKVKELKAADPKLADADANANARTFTRDTEVVSWFSDGTFTTSTDGNTYADFYAKQWQDQQ